MSRPTSKRRRLWRLDTIMVLTMALVVLILGGSALYIGLLLEEASGVVENNRKLSYLSRDKAVEVVEKQLPLESYLRQLTFAAKSFEYEFELLILDPTRSDEGISNIHLEMKRQLIRVRPYLSHLPPGHYLDC